MSDPWAQEFNGDEDEDEALRLAIAMSLGKDPEKKATPKKKQPVMVDLTQDEVDLTQDDIETASEASSPGLRATGKVKTVLPKTESIAKDTKNVAGLNEPGVDEKQPAAEPAPAPVSSLSLLGLDRAKMEEERLARIRKRKAAEGGQGGESDSKRIRINDENRPLVTAGKQNATQKGAQQIGVRPVSQTDKDWKATPRMTVPSAQMATTSFGVRNPTGSSQQQNMTPKKEQSKLPFPKGVVKKTWVKGQPRLGDDIRLEEVLQKDELELALISSFQWDQDWMLDKFDLRKTRLVLVSTGGDEAEVRADLHFLSTMDWLCYGTAAGSQSPDSICDPHLAASRDRFSFLAVFSFTTLQFAPITLAAAIFFIGQYSCWSFL
jgi:hypothetical protein